jgi:hypothetical protein
MLMGSLSSTVVIICFVHVKEEEFRLRLKTNNKSTGEAQSANYLKSRTDYTTQYCQLVNAKLENDELNPALKHSPAGNRSSETSRAHTDQMIETRHRRPRQLRMHLPVVYASAASYVIKV